LRPRPSLRSAIAAGVLSLTATTGATAVVPAVTQADTQGTAPTASYARVGVHKRRLNVRTGQRVKVAGIAQPGLAGLIASLQIRRRSRWRTIDRDRTAPGGHYVLRNRMRRPMSVPARVVLRSGNTRVRERIGRLNSFRYAHASWYGPGLYGNHLGCGGRLTYSRLGVAHKTLPCGTKVTLRHGRRSMRVRVIDRGPYVAGREFDLTQATARRLHFRGHGAILSTR
jgi:rare lipoprotein A (peptidoglycan hydrolase)